MSAILTAKFETFLAQSFLNGLTANTISAYMFLGRPSPWTDDNNPPAPTDMVQTREYDGWRDMIGAKQVSAADTNFVVSRINWTTNTVYAQYDDANASLMTSNFYVLDSTQTPYRVYKCLWNNQGVPSTVAPSTIGNNINPTATSDNYVWQYMYTILSNQYDFLTTDWMPVFTDSTVVTNAKSFPGRLPTTVPLIVINGGAGYNAAATFTATIAGDGANAAISSNGVTIQNGIVASVILSSGGELYTQVTNVAITQNGVSANASVRAIIPPYPNHGADPIKELGAHALLMSVTFVADENGNLTTSNDFRKNGLLINPIEAGGNTANALFYKQTYDLTFTANTGLLNPDDVVTNTTKSANLTAVVVDVISTPNTANSWIARVTTVVPEAFVPPFSNGDIVECVSSGAEITVASVSAPQLQPYTGQIVYVNQRTPVLRAPNQNEEIKIVITFG